MRVEVELDPRGRWVVVVAGCSRACRESLRDALETAGGGTFEPGWIDAVAGRLEAAARSG